jgi:hypothetical protein
VTAREAGKRSADVQRKVAAEDFASGTERAPVPSRVRDDKEHVLHCHVVAQLEHHPAVDRLDIRKTRLDLEGVTARLADDRGVPRSPVVATCEWDLDLEACSDGQAFTKAVEYAQLSGIAHRVSVGEEPEARHEPDGNAGAA